MGGVFWGGEKRTETQKNNSCSQRWPNPPDPPDPLRVLTVYPLSSSSSPSSEPVSVTLNKTLPPPQPIAMVTDCLLHHWLDFSREALICPSACWMEQNRSEPPPVATGGKLHVRCESVSV